MRCRLCGGEHPTGRNKFCAFCRKQIEFMGTPMWKILLNLLDKIEKNETAIDRLRDGQID